MTGNGKDLKAATLLLIAQDRKARLNAVLDELDKEPPDDDDTPELFPGRTWQEYEWLIDLKEPGE